MEPGQGEPRNIKNIVDFLAAMVSTMIEAHDERHIQDANFKRTIGIPTMGVKTTEFDVPNEKKDLLFWSGYNAAKDFFSCYSEEKYRDMHCNFKREEGIEKVQSRKHIDTDTDHCYFNGGRYIFYQVFNLKLFGCVG